MKPKFEFRDVASIVLLFGLIAVGVHVIGLEHRILDQLRILSTPVVSEVVSEEPLLVEPSDDNPHLELIEKADTQVGASLSTLARLIQRDEQSRSRPYRDSKGNPTIGVGRNLWGNGISVEELSAISGEIDQDLLLRETHVENGRVRIRTMGLANRVFVEPLTDHDIHLLLVHDLSNVTNEAISIFGRGLWSEISEARRLAILDILFNLGRPHFETFVKFIGAVKSKDWKTASAELLLSDAAKLNIVRFGRASAVIRSNSKVLFDLK